MINKLTLIKIVFWFSLAAILFSYLIFRNKKRKAVPKNIKKEVMKKCNSRCVVCGSKEYPEIHHKNNKSWDNNIDNLTVLCRGCHFRVPKRRTRL